MISSSGRRAGRCTCRPRRSGLRSSGYLQAIHTEAQLAWARERVRDLTGKGHAAELLDAGAARKLEPDLNPDLPGYVHYPERAQADPVKAMRAFAEAATRSITQPRWEGKTMSGADYFVEHAVPNFYFHLTTAYALLRANGVGLGKRDYLGALTQRAP